MDILLNLPGRFGADVHANQVAPGASKILSSLRTAKGFIAGL